MGAGLIEFQDYLMFALVFIPVIAWITWVSYTWRSQNADADRARRTEQA